MSAAYGPGRGASGAYQPLMIGGYTLADEIGHGGMGRVYKARSRFGAPVALKVILPEVDQDEERRARFDRERRALEAVDHPSIVGYVDAGVDGGTAWIAMELLSGTSLQRYLEIGWTLDQHHALDMLRQLSAALRACWEAGFSHRDIKPENVIVENLDPGLAFRTCLCDFGLAVFVDPRPGEFVSDPKQAVGTAAFMSPEQAKGRGAADPRHDIFGLGMTVLTGMLGWNPIEQGSTSTIISHIAYKPVDLSCLEGRVSPELIRLIGGMVAPLEERFADWKVVQQAVADVTAVALRGDAPAIGSP